jgi:fibronectin-binding autotransporter adhesin
MRRNKRLAILGAAVGTVLSAANFVQAETFTWQGSGNDSVNPSGGIWTAQSFWQGDNRPLADPAQGADYTNRATYELVFGGTDLRGPYTSINDYSLAVEMNILRFQSSATNAANTISAVDASQNIDYGSTIRLIANGSTAPRIFGDGSGAFNIDMPVEFAANTILAGGGQGRISLRQALSGTGSLEVQGGNFWITGTANLTNIPSLNFGTTGGGGGTLTLDLSTGGAGAQGRLNDNIPITFGNGGGILAVNGGAETVGNITMAGGANRLSVSQTATLQTGTFNRTGGVMDFAATGGTLGGSSSGPRILFPTAPTLTNSLIGGWATVNGQDFATYGANGVAAFTGYTPLPASGFDANTNYQQTGNQTLTGSGNIYTVKFNAPTDQVLDLGSQNLTVAGGILKVGAGTTTINGTGAFGSVASELIMTVSQGAMTFNAPFAAVNWTKAGAGGLNLTINSNPVWNVASWSGAVNLNVTADATITGQLLGGGSLVKNGNGKLILTNQNSGWTGGFTLNGGTVEVQANSSAQNLLLDGHNSPLGSSGDININGGTLKLTSADNGSTVGAITLTRRVAFGANGGVLDMNNTVGGTLNSGGQSFALVVPTGSTNVSTVRFNGGERGFSDTGNFPNWNSGGNAVRFSSYTGNSPLRIELTKAGTFRQGNGSGGTVTIPMPVTIAGQIGGDPTSGPNGTTNTSTTTNTGHVANDNFATVVYSQGLNLEGALQFSAQGAARAIGGNITLKGTGAANGPAYVVFNGRGTGTALGSTINTPGNGAAGQNPLYVGRTTDTLTIEDGAIAVLDTRIRTDQSRSSGAFLEAATVINAGGTLRFFQSLNNGTATGYDRVNNKITGQGTTAKESTVDIYLPNADTSSDSLRLNGVQFTSSTALAVNGTGLGGLRVNGLDRPAALLNGTGITEVSSDQKIANLLTQSRLAGLTGTGGYLTVAAQSGTFALPTGSEWAASVPVGLRVGAVGSGNGLTNVALPSGSAWAHNLHVDANATLGVDGVTVNNGTTPTVVSGLGTLNTGTGVTFATGVTVAPGAAGVAGTLAAKGNAKLNTGAILKAEITGATYGSLRSTDNVDITGSTLTVTPTNVTAGAHRWDVVATDTDANGAGSVVGKFGTLNLPANESGNLGRIWSVVYEPTKVAVGFTIGGDANYDGTVNFGDLLILAKNYNQTNTQWTQGNFTGDNLVNFSDLLVLAKNYNQAAPADIPGASAAFEADVAAAFAAVPEPGTLGLVGLGVAGLLGGRRRRRRA